MATITGGNGTAGHNGTSPTAGGDGQDESYTLNGNIITTVDPITVTGGNGGKGGNGTGGNPGAPGGRGGNANIGLNGNIIMPASGAFNLTATGKGGKGGAGGTGTPPGDGGSGGDASVLLNGNIIQASNNLSTITLEAVATAGAGGAAGGVGGNIGSAGNADATLNGNIVQYNGSSAANATVAAIATGATGDSTAHDGDSSWGSKTATLTGNIVQGNLNNVTLQADAKFSNSSAVITGNIIQTNATNTGTVTIEATGEHIDIEKNKVTLGKQNFALTLNELDPDYDTTVKGNTFTGSGTNTFIFTDNATPGPSPDVISIDLGAKKFVFNGDNNTLKGFANITINGTAGMTLTGDSGNNKITGGAGNDTIIATAGTDTYDGGGGVNTLDYSENAMGPGGVTVNLSLTTAQPIGGGFGPDTILNIQNLIGTDFNDILTGSSANNVIDALGGDDTVFATAGNDTYDGGAGTDTLDYSLATNNVTASLTTGTRTAGTWSETFSNFENLNGSAKNDTLTGDSGNNIIHAGAGNDTIIATDGTDTYDGGTGTNTVDFSNSPVGVTVNLTTGTATGWGTDTLTGIQKVIGSSHNDTITGSTGNDTILAGDGNDTINATLGTDTYDGGNGTDTLSYAGATVGVTVDLSLTGQQNVAAGYKDTITNIEKLTGTSQNDFLAGSGLGGNTLSGGAGNDILYSRGGGTNSLVGAGGTDVAYYDGLETDYSTVTPTHVVGGPDGANDTLSGVERLKFLAPSHVSDINNDGTGDLVVQMQSPSGAAAVVLEPGSTYNPTISTLTANQRIVGTGQFDPDASRDAGLLIQSNTGTRQIYILPDPLTAPAAAPILVNAPGANWNVVTAGDFNGDASSDILIQNSTTGQAKILFLKENSTDAVGTVNATTVVTPPNGTGWKAIAAGDFNGDGKSDILWQQGAGGAVEVTLMNGATVTNPTPTPLAPPAGYTAVATGDFNDDGKSDIVFSTGPAGSAAEIWTMNGDSVTGTSSVLAPTTGLSGPGTFTLMGAEDVNGDGVSDLLWQNTVNGDIDASLMTNPSTYTQSGLLVGIATSHLVASTGGG